MNKKMFTIRIKPLKYNNYISLHFIILIDQKTKYLIYFTIFTIIINNFIPESNLYKFLVIIKCLCLFI
jgi:hypothetical protein